MNDQNIIFFRKFHDFFVKSRSGNASYRVGRQGYYHIFSLIRYFFRNSLYIGKEIMLCNQRIIVRNCSCHQTSCCKYGIARIRKKYCISLITKRHAKMPHSFLTSINSHYHVRCQFHIKTFLIISTDCVQKLRQIAETVFPVVIIHSCFRYSFLDIFRSLEIRSSHTHVIDLHALCFQLHTPVVQSSKNFISKSVQSF